MLQFPDRLCNPYWSYWLYYWKLRTRKWMPAICVILLSVFVTSTASAAWWAWGNKEKDKSKEEKEKARLEFTSDGRTWHEATEEEKELTKTIKTAQLKPFKPVAVTLPLPTHKMYTRPLAVQQPVKIPKIYKQQQVRNRL